MRMGFWIKRAFTVFAAVSVLLVAVELIKGHGFEAGIKFALMWSSVATAIFIGTRIYYVSRGKNCPMCNDLPQGSRDIAVPPNS